MIYMANDKFRTPILKALSNGPLKTADALNIVYKQIYRSLKAADRDDFVSGGEPMWRNRARWVKLSLVQEGLVTSLAHGTWSLTKEGTKLAKSL